MSGSRIVSTRIALNGAVVNVIPQEKDDPSVLAERNSKDVMDELTFENLSLLLSLGLFLTDILGCSQVASGSGMRLFLSYSRCLSMRFSLCRHFPSSLEVKTNACYWRTVN
jgi:hypothetical protein